MEAECEIKGKQQLQESQLFIEGLGMNMQPKGNGEIKVENVALSQLMEKNSILQGLVKTLQQQITMLSSMKAKFTVKSEIDPVYSKTELEIDNLYTKLSSFVAQLCIFVERNAKREVGGAETDEEIKALVSQAEAYISTAEAHAMGAKLAKQRFAAM